MTDKTISLHLAYTGNIWASWARRIGFTLAVFVPGVILDSSAMQWLGFMMIIMVSIGFGVSQAKKNEKLTAEQAHARIDELKAEGAIA